MEDDFFGVAFMIIFLLFVSPVVFTLFVSGDLFNSLGSAFGELLFDSSGYGIGISSWSYGVSLFFGTIFGVGWAITTVVPLFDGEYRAIFRLTFGTIIGIALCVLTALAFYRFATPTTTTDIETLNRLGIVPGQLVQTIVVLAFAKVINFGIETVLDSR